MTPQHYLTTAPGLTGTNSTESNACVAGGVCWLTYGPQLTPWTAGNGNHAAAIKYGGWRGTHYSESFRSHDFCPVAYAGAELMGWLDREYWGDPLVSQGDSTNATANTDHPQQTPTTDLQTNAQTTPFPPSPEGNCSAWVDFPTSPGWWIAWDGYCPQCLDVIALDGGLYVRDVKQRTWPLITAVRDLTWAKCWSIFHAPTPNLPQP